jgi:16S rRNA A1518/A1519 N6-dimethyltransferase RsmA/KsgA/DIM1 with predicted DNA glycosylase/AP lyase activity
MRTIHKTPYKIQHSQNFLRNKSYVAKLVSLMNLADGDNVVEIGPGSGQITKELLPRVKSVIAVEQDKSLSDKLPIRFLDPAKLSVVNEDFLEYTLPSSPHKVVGNIPFALTAKIVNKLTKHQIPASEIYLIVQEEVAQKFMGEPLTTLQSLLLAPLYDVRILEFIPRAEFIPMPAVNAALVNLHLKSEPLMDQDEYVDWEKFVTTMFADFYPHVFALLKKQFSQGAALAIQKHLQMDLRVQRADLSYKQWRDIWEWLRR